MPTAYVLINYEIGAEAEKNVLNRLETVPGIVEASEVNGVMILLATISATYRCKEMLVQMKILFQPSVYCKYSWMSASETYGI